MSKEQHIHDLLVVGGGINGVGIAVDAAGRGLDVVLCEMNDLASATSSNSSKLIHGGLRYLEYYEFRLVKEALAEREVLLQKAPHIMWPLRFRLPHRPHLRPAWMIRAGLFLYDHLSKRATLKASHGIKFGEGSALKPMMKRGFEYSDGWVDDARLVVLNAMAAQEKGADIRTNTCCISAVRKEDYWLVALRNELTGDVAEVKVRMLVNAAGPWVSSLFETALDSKPPKQVRLVKGSHIIVPKIHDEPEAYILQNEDNRIVFVIPYEDDFSLIGTTDVEHFGDPAEAKISDDEINYLIEVTNAHFTKQIKADNVVSTYAGVRPLMDDESDNAQAVTRDYTYEVDAAPSVAPIISVFGGKITTYRKLAEAVTDKVAEFFPHAGLRWTADALLPGGDFSDKVQLQAQLAKQYPWLESSIIRRYVRSYGTLCQRFLKDCASTKDMGEHFGAGLYQSEVEYLLREEWALTLEDILWRRSKLGLRLTQTQQLRLNEFLTADSEKAIA